MKSSSTLHAHTSPDGSTPYPAAFGMSEDQMGHLIKSYRDWRIDLEHPDRCLTFAVGVDLGGGATQLAPLSYDSPSIDGRGRLKGAFAMLARAICEQRPNRALLTARLSNLTGADEVPPAENSRSFAVIACGVRCRVQHIAAARYHVRVTSELPPLSEMGMPAPVQARLMGPDLSEGGLVVICGSYGSGKTSTVNATIRERVSLKGGYALLMGNPIEYEIAGFHGTSVRPGFIEQVDLVGRNLASEVKASVRNFPAGSVSILGYPELTSSDGVGELLRAANRGSLVFCDMHALSPEAAVLNLVALGQQDGEMCSRELLGNSLRLIVHLKMLPSPKSKRGVAVSYTVVSFDLAARSALMDTTMPLSRAILAATQPLKEGAGG